MSYATDLGFREPGWRAQRKMRVIAASTSLFDKARIEYRQMAPDHFHVADAFSFHPSTGRWRSFDGRATGYGAGALVVLAKAISNQESIAS